MNILNTSIQRSWLLSWGSLLFFISSGFSTQVRFFGLLLIFLSVGVFLLKHPLKIYPNKLWPCIFLISSYAIGLLNNILFIEEKTEIFWLTFIVFFLFPILIIFINNFPSTYIQSTINFISIILGSLFFIFFLILLIFQNSIGPLIIIAMKSFPGGYYYREFWSVQNYPSIWTQASILAMPLAVFHLFKGNTKLFIFLSIVVFLSLNRTGSFLILFMVIIKNINYNRIAKIFLTLFAALPFLFLGVILVLYYIHSDNFNSEFTGFDIRLGHVLSVINNLKDNFVWLFGMGADSEFVSIGWDGDGITRDQEISYLEILRRFGLLGYILFNLGIFLSLFQFFRNSNWPSFFSFICYMIFSFTNPCLVSFIFVLYYALIMSNITVSEKIKSNNYYIWSSNQSN
jgi:hypothetical protein